MNVASFPLFADQNDWHRKQAALAIDRARDYLDGPEPDFQSVLRHLALATEFVRMMDSESSAPRRSKMGLTVG